ncbi:hypothetical protein [Actinophytocola sp.]|uniref:hypothetical protein n=1 Tax=Actinophytocola sp. TaxID=1872138 RepID=UPI002ED81D68
MSTGGNAMRQEDLSRERTDVPPPGDRRVEPPRGYDYPATDRIPVQGAAQARPEQPPASEAAVQAMPAPVPTPVPAPVPGAAEPPGAPAEPPPDFRNGTDPAAQATDLREGTEPPGPVAAADWPRQPAATAEEDSGAVLFGSDDIDRFRTRWRELQADFVDDPKQAVRGADELVGEVVRSLAEIFARHKHELAGGWQGGGETEELRVALRRYRSFFDRLLNA